MSDSRSTTDRATRSTRSTRSTAGATSPGAQRTYLILVSLGGLAILLQALWAGLFVHEGEDYKDSWVQVHARGADTAIGLMVVATIVAFVAMRHRRDLLAGGVAVIVLLFVEAYIGGLIGDKPDLTVIHFPLGMALMGLAVWLPLRALRG